MPEEGVKLADHEDILTYEEMLRVVRVFAENGISKVRLTGGEPLIRKGIVDLVHGIAHTEGIGDVSLTTNGVLLKDYAWDLKAAGLRRINVSLDSLRPDRFAFITRRDRFERVWDGLHEALTCGLSPVKINVVVIKGFNDDEVKAFAGLGATYPFHVRFIEFMPVGQENGWTAEQVLPNSYVMHEIGTLGDLIPVASRSGNDGPALRYRFPGGKGEIGFITPISSHFCAQCNRLRLTAEGQIRPCLFSDEEIDLRGPLRAGAGDDVLVDLLNEALSRKPHGHRVGDIRFKKCQRSMYAIGG